MHVVEFKLSNLAGRRLRLLRDGLRGIAFGRTWSGRGRTGRWSLHGRPVKPLQSQHVRPQERGVDAVETGNDSYQPRDRVCLDVKLLTNVLELALNGVGGHQRPPWGWGNIPVTVKRTGAERAVLTAELVVFIVLNVPATE